MLKRQPLDKKWSLFLVLAAVAILLMFYTLWRTSSETVLAGDPQHTLSQSLVSQLYDAAPTLSEKEGLTHLYVTCTALEGSLCYFVPPESVATFDFGYNPDFQNERYRVERDLAFAILGDLDVKHVERAKNNTVLLHCQRYADGTVDCTLNGGSEHWYPVTLL